MIDFNPDSVRSKAKPELLDTVVRQLRRHLRLLTVPPFLFGLIYLDYNHTQKWKRESQLAEPKE